jgi:GNAT superfamily N-acetyltransferase
MTALPAAPFGALTPAIARGDPQFAGLYLGYLSHFGVAGCYEDYAPLLERSLADGWIFGLVAYVGRSMSGFCIYCRTYSVLARSPAWLIEDFYVAAPLRRLGIGTGLLGALRQAAAAQAVRRVFVQSDRHDPAMVGFYARNGFVDGDASLFRLELD